MSDQPRSLSRAAAAVLLLYLLVRGVAHAPMLPAGLAPWMPYIADGLFLVSLFLPALWGIRAAPSLSEAASAAATAAKVGAFLLVFLAPSMAFASPAIPSAGRGWMIVTGCMAILGAVVGLLVAACRLVERRQRRRAGLCVAVVLILAAPARADEPAPAPQPAPVLVAAPALPPVVAPLPTVPPAHALTRAEQVQIAAQSAVAGVEAARSVPVSPGFWQTKGGQIMSYILDGCLIVATTAGAVAGVWVAAR